MLRVRASRGTEGADQVNGSGVAVVEDECLPGSLEESLEQAAAGVVRFVKEGGRGDVVGVRKCVVELVLPELFGSMRGNVLAKEGDQMRIYDLCKRLVSAVQDETRKGGMTKKIMVRLSLSLCCVCVDDDDDVDARIYLFRFMRTQCMRILRMTTTQYVLT